MKNNTTVEFPKYLSIQTTSICNANCIFCPYDEIKDLFPGAIMSETLFKKIIDECSRYKDIERIILYLNNEPLTDPDLIKRINYTKEKVPWANLHILTNGSLLTEELSRNLIDSGLDWIGFSLHGVKKETIEKAMGLNYDLVFNRVANFIEKARAKRNIRDFIMVTFLKHKYLTEEERDETIKYWRDKGIERISYFEAPISRAGNVKDLPPAKHKEIGGCNSIWANEMIHIVENGDVILCCMDWKREIKLGNINEKNIYTIWNSKRYKDIRAKRDGRKESEDNFLCKRCEAAVIPEGAGKIDTNKAGLNLRERENPDILLVICPPWGVDVPPLSLACLSSYLRQSKFKTQVFDFNVHLYNRGTEKHKYLWEMGSANYWRKEDSFEQLLSIFQEEIEFCVKKIISSGAKTVGFSISSNSQDRITIEVIKRVKRNAPDIKIILGGVSVSIPEQRFLFEKEVPGLIDVYVIGEGEETLSEVLKAIKYGRPLEEIPGVLIYQNGRYISSPPRPLQDNLDKLPVPTFEEFELSSYFNRGKGLIMEWSRGCIGSCSFCAFKTVSPDFRIKKPEAIVKAIRYYVQRYGAEHFSLVDSAINGDLKWLENICNLLIEENLNIRFSALAIPRKGMDYRLLEKMKKSGFVRIEYGVESGSNKVLKAMRKNYNSKDVEKVIKETHQAGLLTVIYLLVGFPGEGDKEFKETVDFLRTNASYIDLVKSINPLYLMAGSPIYSRYQEYGILLPKIDPDFKWSIGKENTYDIRLERVKKIRSTLNKLGVKYFSEDDMFERKIYYQKINPGGSFGKMNGCKLNRLQKKMKSNRRRAKTHNLFKFVILGWLFIYILGYMAYFWAFKKIRGKALLGGK